LGVISVITPLIEVGDYFLSEKDGSKHSAMDKFIGRR